MDILSTISVRTPMKVRGFAFRELFAWLSMSLASVSRTSPGESLQVEKPGDWVID